MQGIEAFIPTNKKADYINTLLNVGFDTIDFGSFVSPKAIPQMKDTAAVLDQLQLDESSSSLLAIIANERGAIDAISHEEIKYLGYPFSVSETFQERNTNATIDESLLRVEQIQNHCIKHNRTLVVYLSMAFGNPYCDPWHPDIVAKWAMRLVEELDIKILSLADTIGVSDKRNIKDLFETIIPEFPLTEIGAHLHSKPDDWLEKMSTALDAGCKRVDGAIKGYGGCPMAADDLTGNMATENILDYLNKNCIDHSVDMAKFNEALLKSNDVFLSSH
jgi:hydroxymethylglutaryl-CoA lyase